MYASVCRELTGTNLSSPSVELTPLLDLRCPSAAGVLAARQRCGAGTSRKCEGPYLSVRGNLLSNPKSCK